MQYFKTKMFLSALYRQTHRRLPVAGWEHFQEGREKFPGMARILISAWFVQYYIMLNATGKKMGDSSSYFFYHFRDCWSE